MDETTRERIDSLIDEIREKLKKICEISYTAGYNKGFARYEEIKVNGYSKYDPLLGENDSELMKKFIKEEE